MITFTTPEEFEAYDLELGARHQAHIRAQGFPDYWCETVFGTPEPNEQGEYVITDEMLANYPHLK